jgi:membrane protein DedA with SNARE-associated domain
MPSVEHAFEWLTALSPIWLYAAAFGFAFIEAIFPPSPSDLLIGVCAFVAAPGDASLGVTFAAVVAGNIVGATAVFIVARRYGAAGLRARLMKRGWVNEEAAFERMHRKYGTAGMFIGRFIPGVRGVVPMAAGAFGISMTRTITVVAIAAALWYGLLTSLAYTVGGNWQEYAARIRALGLWGTVIGTALLVGAIIGAVIGFRRARARLKARDVPPAP